MKNEIRALLYMAYRHGKNDMWESNFNEWLEEEGYPDIDNETKKPI